MMENNIDSVKTQVGFKSMQSNALPLSYTHSVVKTTTTTTTKKTQKKNPQTNKKQICCILLKLGWC